MPPRSSPSSMLPTLPSPDFGPASLPPWFQTFSSLCFIMVFCHRHSFDLGRAFIGMKYLSEDPSLSSPKRSLWWSLFSFHRFTSTYGPHLYSSHVPCNLHFLSYGRVLIKMSYDTWKATTSVHRSEPFTSSYPPPGHSLNHGLHLLFCSQTPLSDPHYCHDTATYSIRAPLLAYIQFM